MSKRIKHTTSSLPSQLTLKFLSVGIVATSGLALMGFSPLTLDRSRVPVISTFKASQEIAASLKNWGLVNARGNSHIQATDAWRITEGSRQIIVAVIDTGLDSSHKALAENVWNDPNSTVPVYGWNFVGNQANPKDEHGHGTHVAGIIGAVTDPKAGISGVARKVSIMAVKYYSDANPGAVNLQNTVKAIQYAIDHGARIINYSGGGPEFSNEEYLAIKKAEAAGILVVAAAGNERQDTDKEENKYYPAAYRTSNLISVAATDINNKLLVSSNWGKLRVDVAAPGENIYSTLPNGKFGYMSGTSQATAFVSGMAALLLSENPKLTPQQIKQIIMGSVDTFPHLREKLAAGGRVNAYKALSRLIAMRDITDPGASTRDRAQLQSAGRAPVSLMNSLITIPVRAGQ